MRSRCSRLSGAKAGFTLIELLIAFGLMVVLLSTVYIIFDTGSKVFSVASARIEIMETARTIFHVMERDLTGATLDSDGRVFRGYSWAYYGTQDYGARQVFGLPGVGSDWRGTCLYLGRDQARQLPFVRSDLLWFRTPTAPEGRGKDIEIIYRLQMTHSTLARYYGGTFERCWRTSWLPASSVADDIMTSINDARGCDPITAFPPKYVSVDSDDTAMQTIPLAPFCYDLKFDFLDSMRWDTRDVLAFRMRSGYGYGTWCDTWPVVEAWPPRYNSSGAISEQMSWGSNIKWTAKECRLRLPAAVRCYMRIGDANQSVWTDSAVNDGYVMRDLDSQQQVDEVGMVFEQLFFLPNHTKYPYTED